VIEINDGQLKKYEISPADYGIRKASFKVLQCGTKEEYKKMALEVLKGNQGPALDMVSLNAAAALYVTGQANSIGQGVEIAKDLLKRGAVYKKLEEIVSFSKNMEI